jgi:hypothetical protein
MKKVFQPMLSKRVVQTLVSEITYLKLKTKLEKSIQGFWGVGVLG